MNELLNYKTNASFAIKIDTSVKNSLINIHLQLEIFNSIAQQNDTTNLCLIKACIQLNEYENEIKLIDSLKTNENKNNINNFSIEFITTLNFYGKNGNIKSAENIFNISYSNILMNSFI